jgi:uncharacterized protein YodC (DUF2158 family)
MSEFKLGDVVRLKSGGPDMTVRTIGSDGDNEQVVFCDWFDGKIERRGSYPTTSLETAAKRVVGVRPKSKGDWMG